MSNGAISGKLALVTGAGSGIGRAVCCLFAREGAKVVAVDQNVKAAEDTVAALQGSGHLVVHLNVTNTKDIEDAFIKIVKHYSMPPTIIVNCAGILNASLIVDTNENAFDNLLDINLKGTFFVIKSAVKAMIASGNTKDASIINLGSIAAQYGFARFSVYGISKAGVANLTKTASIEFKDLGIRVNAVFPGLTDTSLLKKSSEQSIQAVLDRSSIKRLGKPEEVAELVLFLASSKSSYITGTSIEISGGYS